MKVQQYTECNVYLATLTKTKTARGRSPRFTLGVSYVTQWTHHGLLSTPR